MDWKTLIQTLIGSPPTAQSEFENSIILMSSGNLDENFSKKPSAPRINLAWILGHTCSGIYDYLTIHQRHVLHNLYHAQGRSGWLARYREFRQEREEIRERLRGVFLPIRLTEGSVQEHRI